MRIVRKLFHYLCILVVLIIQSCQDDSIIDTQQKEILQNKTTFKTSILYKQDIQANIKLQDKVRSLSTIKKQQIAKSVYNAVYDFTIDTNIAKFIENSENDSHSYTFSIARTDNSNSTVENIVFTYNVTNDSYDASLVSYLFSDEQKQEFLQNGYVNTPYDITHESISIDIDDVMDKSFLPIPCTTNYTVYHITPDTGDTFLHSSTEDNILNQCQHENEDENPCVTYTVIEIDCPDGGSPGHSTDDHSTNSTSNNSTSGGGGSSDSDTTTDGGDEPTNIVTSIVSREENVKKSILDCINGLSEFNTVDTTTIDSTIFNLNNLTLNDWIEIDNYLQENECNEEVQQEVIEDIIEAYDNYQIINELEGKALCVFNKLKSSSIGFKNSIKLFDGDFPVAHLKYQNSSALPSSVNAQTSPPSNFLINIEINENNLNRPNLSIARTIIHETIHAEMFRKILSILDNGGDLDGLTRTEWINKLSNGDYPGIYDYFVRYGGNDMQHEQMAAHYRNVIKNMLIEFQPGLSQDIYEALAWVGLKDTETWNALTDTEKATINSTINTFNATGAEECN